MMVHQPLAQRSDRARRMLELPSGGTLLRAVAAPAAGSAGIGHDLALIRKSLESGDLAEAEQSLEQRAARPGSPDPGGLCGTTGLHIARGRIRLAEELVARAPLEARDPLVTRGWDTHLYALAWLRGRLAFLYEPLVALREETPDFRPWLAPMAHVSAHLNQLAEAQHCLDGALGEETVLAELSRAEEFNGTLVWQLAEACLRLGDEDSAKRITALLPPDLAPVLISPDGTGVVGSSPRLRGILALAEGDIPSAVEHLTAAVQWEDQIGAAPLAAVSRLDLAQALTSTGRRSERHRARELLDEAVPALTTMEMHAHLGQALRIRRDLSALSASPPPANCAPAPSRPAAEPTELQFIRRVAERAAQAGLPVADRVRYLSIAARLLDTFCATRLTTARAVTGSTDVPGPEADRLRDRTAELADFQQALWRDSLQAATAAGGLGFCPLTGDAFREVSRAAFEQQVRPVLAPLFRGGSPFPLLSSMGMGLFSSSSAPGAAPPHQVVPRLGLVVTLEDQDDDLVLQLPSFLPPLVRLGAREVASVERVVAAHLDDLLPERRIRYCHPFRAVRSTVTGPVGAVGPDDRLWSAEHSLRRQRAGWTARLEVLSGTPQHVRRSLADRFRTEPTDVGTLHLAGLDALAGWLAGPRTRSGRPARKSRSDWPRPEGLLDEIRQRDILVHRPYDSYAVVERFLHEAARDPDVTAIRQTIYRTSGPDSTICQALLDAAARGKDVSVIVEVTADFDEAANIAWARGLRTGGVRVLTSPPGHEVHAKTCLVLRREQDRVRGYALIDSGNFNEETARSYEDVGLLTAAQDVSDDLAAFYDYLSDPSAGIRAPTALLVSPANMSGRLLRLIDREGARGRAGRIVIKANNIDDPHICAALFAAAASGASLDVTVRSTCALDPAITALHDRVTVRSIAGSVLHHSRIYRFGSKAKGDWFIGSADLTARSMGRRFEVLTPVRSPVIRARLVEAVRQLRLDDTASWLLTPSGGWERVPSVKGVDVHRRLYDLADERLADGAKG